MHETSASSLELLLVLSVLSSGVVGVVPWRKLSANDVDSYESSLTTELRTPREPLDKTPLLPVMIATRAKNGPARSSRGLPVLVPWHPRYKLQCGEQQWEGNAEGCSSKLSRRLGQTVAFCIKRPTHDATRPTLVTATTEI